MRYMETINCFTNLGKVTASARDWGASYGRKQSLSGLLEISWSAASGLHPHSNGMLVP